MYKFEVSEELLGKLKHANATSPSVLKKLAALAQSPLAEAIKTNIPIIGSYYTNCGRWCLLFDVSEKDEKIRLLHLVLSPYLHKIITGRINPN